MPPLFVAACLGALLDPEPPPSIAKIPIAFHAAGDAQATMRTLRSWVDAANRLYGPHGIRFEVAEVRPLPAERSKLATVAERRSLARRLVPRAVNVFVVDAILDEHPDGSTVRAAARAGFVPSGRLAGAHVPAAGRTPETYVILLRDGGATTLAHELGHLLGAPHHADPENVMSYGRNRHRFDERQIAAFQATARRFARQGWARP